MERELIEFIKSEVIINNDIIIEPDTKLISSGIMDSFSLITLQIYIEKKFGVRIPAARITVESFDSVGSMAAIIKECTNHF